MLHVMIDAYRSLQSKLDDMKYVYEVINKITYYLDVKPIMPPMMIPYYYGTVPEDSGVSAFVLLDGGHFTIHTFAYRECYFIDLLYDGFFDSDKLGELIKRELPCVDMRIQSFDRRFKSEIAYHGTETTAHDFGPHLIARIEPINVFNMDSLFDLFESLPFDLDMSPIMRPYLLKSSKSSPNYLSGMTLIAQSHIAMHYKYSEQVLYIDMFSCSFTDFSRFQKALDLYFGIQIQFELIIRGSKHDYIKTDLDKRKIRYNAWQDNTA